MNHYIVMKSSKPNRWHLTKAQEGGKPFYLGSYPSSKQAIAAGRLLAGWCGSVSVLRKGTA